MSFSEDANRLSASRYSCSVSRCVKNLLRSDFDNSGSLWNFGDLLSPGGLGISPSNQGNRIGEPGRQDRLESCFSLIRLAGAKAKHYYFITIPACLRSVQPAFAALTFQHVQRLPHHVANGIQATDFVPDLTPLVTKRCLHGDGIESADCFHKAIEAFAKGFNVQSLEFIHGIPPMGHA
jgi:hypothetical protein